MLRAFFDLIFDLADDAERAAKWLRANPIGGLGLLFVAIFLFWLADRWFKGSEILKAGFWEKDPEGIRNLIWAMASVFGGAAGLYGLYLAGRRTNALDRQAQIAHEHRVLAEQSQITERFTKAVEQLGHDQTAVRLGAIYALERIAKDSERDFETIMETLAAYIRERASRGRNSQNQHANFYERDERIDKDLPRKPTVDIVAAISVIVRSIPDEHRLRSGVISRRIDLRDANLRGLDLPGANFSGFRFDDSILADAILMGASFEDAGLKEVSFDGADLSNCDFSSAILLDASLREAELQKANFQRAILIRAALDEASLYKAIFRNAILEMASLVSAHLEGAVLVSAHLEGANLHGAYLSQADLKDSKFRNADLSHAELNESDSTLANFDGANLTGANFECANVSKAKFRNTLVDSVDFDDVRNMTSEQMSEVKFYEMYPPTNLPEDVSLPTGLSKRDHA